MACRRSQSFQPVQIRGWLWQRWFCAWWRDDILYYFISFNTAHSFSRRLHGNIIDIFDFFACASFSLPACAPAALYFSNAKGTVTYMPSQPFHVSRNAARHFHYLWRLVITTLFRLRLTFSFQFRHLEPLVSLRVFDYISGRLRAELWL